VLSLRTWALVRPRSDGVLRVGSRHFEDELAFPARELQKPAEALHFEQPWHRYAVGPLWALAQSGVPVAGADVWIDGELPLGGGLSSSAAIEVSLITVFAAIAGRQLAAKDVARMGQRAEHEIARVPCGIMDQLASATGSDGGQALCIDCRSLEVTPVPLRASLALLVVDSGVRHALASSEYARRQQECAEGLRQLGVASARDLRLPHLAGLADVPRRRLRHVVTEIERVRLAAKALDAGDHAALGALLYASHDSLRDDYEVSCKELDAIVDAARRIPDVVGARMTGGGFGGNAIVIAQRHRADKVRAELAARFSVMVVSAGSAPTVWKHDS
jgi:galactokinase